MQQKNKEQNNQYPEFNQLKLSEVDKQILDFWETNETFKNSIDSREGNKPFVFYEGPPSANGKPGIHHVMGRTVKDIFCRYKTLQGYQVKRKGGWDTHGLPVELKVEKELGITKEDIGTKITVEEYNQKCRETVMQFKDVWDDITRKMGYWVDLDNPYITFDNDYIETVWFILKQLYNKDLLYKGYTIQPYSPAAGTGLSSHELNMPGAYKDVKDTTVVAQFKVVKNKKSAFLFDNDDEDVRFIAWTTTPWTLPSNTALAVGPKIDYVKVQTFNPYTFKPVSLVLAKELVAKWFNSENENVSFNDYEAGNKNIPYRIETHFKGETITGIEYEQLLPFKQPEDGDAFKVIPGKFVTTSDGTGIVHIAPSFGADDKQVAEENGIGSLTLVDKQGKFIDGVGEFSGRYVKDYTDNPNYKNVDIDIAIKLKEENKAFNVQKYEHNYPHCWRTDKPVLYYPLDSWFIKTTSVKDDLIANNNAINWKPKHTGEGRFGKWLEELKDWNLSRSRFWGIPLPIWRTEDGEEELIIGSVEELNAEMQKANAQLGLNNQPLDDLHKPYIDHITLVSPSGKPMKRETDVIDVWFDSGSMPYASQENFDWAKPNQSFPADFIAEGVDQTRGWFFTLHAISTMLFNKVAFKNVIANGLVLDKEGQKMSKRKGNVVDPFETIDNYGADATRWYMITNAQPWDNLKFDLSGIQEVQRKFFGTLYNTYSFYALYANIDGFVVNEMHITPIEDRPEIDRWVLSALYEMHEQVTAAYEDYEPTNAGRAIQKFVTDDLSNWYVRLSRRRFWKGEMNSDKKSAYETLHECLLVVAQLMSPIAPFFADWLYQNMRTPLAEKAIQNATPLAPESVHLTIWTPSQKEKINHTLNKQMELAQRTSSLILSIRKKEGLKVRQPLQKVLIPVINEADLEHFKHVEDLIKSEVNVKTLEYVTGDSDILKKKIKPNFRTLGKKLGKHMKAANQLISNFTQAEIKDIETNYGRVLEFDGTEYALTLDDFEITTADIPGWKVANENHLTVALDITLTEALINEGNAREFVNRVQNLRKEQNFKVTDKIKVSLSGNEALLRSLDKFKDYICTEILATEINMLGTVENGTPLDINDDTILVNLTLNE